MNWRSGPQNWQILLSFSNKWGWLLDDFHSIAGPVTNTEHCNAIELKEIQVKKQKQPHLESEVAAQYAHLLDKDTIHFTNQCTNPGWERLNRDTWNPHSPSETSHAQDESVHMIICIWGSKLLIVFTLLSRAIHYHQHGLLHSDQSNMKRIRSYTAVATLIQTMISFWPWTGLSCVQIAKSHDECTKLWQSIYVTTLLRTNSR